MSRAKSNQVYTERHPVWDYDDPERVEYIKENAVALVKSRDERIRRLRQQVYWLEQSRQEMKRERRSLLAKLEAGHD